MCPVAHAVRASDLPQRPRFLGLPCVCVCEGVCVFSVSEGYGELGVPLTPWPV